MSAQRSMSAQRIRRARLSPTTAGKRLARTAHAALGALAVLLVLAQMVGYAATRQSELAYATGFLITGNYVVGSVDFTEELNPPDSSGISTGVVSISGVPVDADIVAAFLYWEAITLTADPAQASGVTFRGHPIDLDEVSGLKKSSRALIGNTSNCWSSGTPLTMTHFRADVTRFLPIRLDKDNKPTGKRLANSADLAAHGEAPHVVTLPTRNGNQIPESAGATLVVVYRDPSQPLRKILFYDGIHVQDSLDEETRLTISGFYKSAATPSAKVTHILGSGQPNNNEVLSFTDGEMNTTTDISPFNPAMLGTASQRGWISLTYDVSALMHPTTSLSGFGETVTTGVRHSPANGGYDCLTVGAVIFSTAVADVDLDGLPDGLEDATSGLNDPPVRQHPGDPPIPKPLPNLNAMGASSTHKDVFIEVNAMRTLVAKNHGSASAPYKGTGTVPVTVSVPPHTHLPAPPDIRLVAEAYASRGIMAHFDVGDVAAYKSLGAIPHAEWIDDYSSPEADQYLVGNGIGANHVGLARGGEVVDERACNATDADCQFPDFSGVVGFGFGLQLYRDWPVGPNGEELLTEAEVDAWWNGVDHRQRFDRNRNGLFHYVFYGHYRGLSRSDLRCLDLSTVPPTPVDGDASGNCVAPLTVNPDFHVPSGSSGYAERPGDTVLVTLGRWDEFVGRPFVRASTTFHELGHNLNLSHGGFAPVVGNKALNTATVVEPNCKPNYISSMSYQFQVHGLFDDSDNIHLDYSGTDHDDLTEAGLSPIDGPLNPAPLTPYRAAWYAPASSSLAGSLGVSASTRFCNGAPFGVTPPTPAMARVYTLFSNDAIDWNGDGLTNTADVSQDVNFDNAQSATLRGFDDWSNIRLDQISAGRKILKFFGEGGLNLYGEGGLNLFGEGGLNLFGEGGLNLFGEGGLNLFGEGGIDLYGEGGLNLFGEGGLNLFGEGGLNLYGEGGVAQELDFEAAKGLGKGAPYAVQTCVIGTPGCTPAAPFDPTHHRVEVMWKVPTFDSVATNLVSRKQGTATSTYPFIASVPSSSTGTVHVNTEQLPDGVPFTFRIQARFTDSSLSGFSKTTSTTTVTAVNNAPVANPDAYTTRRNQTLQVNTRAQGVLNNDTDVDSPAAQLRGVLVTGPTNSRAFAFNPDGTFSYRPAGGFIGTDTFTYYADNGMYTRELPAVLMSGPSATVTVTITVTP